MATTMTAAVAVGLLSAGVLMTTACGSTRSYQRNAPALSPAARAVEFVAGTQPISQALQERCEPVGYVQTMGSERAFRRQAAAWGANIVQVLYGSTTTSRESVTIGYLNFTERSVVTGPSTVRYWDCAANGSNRSLRTSN